MLFHRKKAYAFESYLKTHCGRAFAKQKIITRQAMEPVNIISETANPDIPQDVVEAANRALINNKISTAVYWNVENTIRQAQDLTRQFPGFSLTVYNDVSEMPSDIQ